MADNNKSHLPHEIIEIIVPKLSSVKSLLRFKAVSKPWNTMISDPVFVQNHQQRSKDLNSQTLFLYPGFSLVKLDDRKLHTVRQVFGAPNGWDDVVCFCKGLVLVTQRAYGSISLWNPTTGQVKTLSLPDSCYWFYFGLCRDPITDDFKVVTVDWCGYYTVYSFKNNSWTTRVKCEFTNYGMPNKTGGGVCVDGASYWAWTNGGCMRITYFDSRDDNFKILQKPKNVEDNEQIYLVDLVGCLCLYCNDRDDMKTVRIWRKKKGIDNNSWEKLMNVENVRMPILWFQPQGFVGNKIVIRDKFNHRIVVYNPYEKTFENFDSTIFGHGLVHGLIPYVDSPFFPTQKPIPN